MLHAIDPLALVLAAVRVGVHPLPVLLVELVMTLIFATVLPHVVSISVHHTVLEAALEVSAIGPLEASSATHLVVAPLFLRAVREDLVALRRAHPHVWSPRIEVRLRRAIRTKRLTVQDWHVVKIAVAVVGHFPVGALQILAPAHVAVVEAQMVEHVTVAA